MRIGLTLIDLDDKTLLMMIFTESVFKHSFVIIDHMTTEWRTNWHFLSVRSRLTWIKKCLHYHFLFLDGLWHAFLINPATVGWFYKNPSLGLFLHYSKPSVRSKPFSISTFVRCTVSFWRFLCFVRFDPLCCKPGLRSGTVAFSWRWT